MSEITIRVFWSAEDDEYVAQDTARPGLTALAPTVAGALREMAAVLELADEARE